MDRLAGADWPMGPTWYGFALAAAIAVFWGHARLVIDRGPTGSLKRSDLAPALFGILLFGAIGARLFHLVTSPPEDGDYLPAALSRYGVTSFGCFIGSSLALIVYARMRKLSVLRASDALVIAAPLALAIVRFGSISTMRDPSAIFTSSATFFASPLVREASFCILVLYPALLMLFQASRNGGAPGLVSALFLGLYGAYRSLTLLVGDNNFELSLSGQWPTALVAGVGCIVASAGVAVMACRSRLGTRPSTQPSCAVEPPPRYSRFTVMFACGAAIFFAGCGSPEQKPPAEALPKVSISYSNPGDDARCQCAGSSAAFVLNDDPNARTVRWVIYRKDRISGQTFTPAEGSDDVQPGSANKRFVGCTIDAPTTSCRFDNNYDIRSSSKKLAIAQPLRKKLGRFSTSSALSCSAICSGPTGTGGTQCLQLGYRFYSAVAPIVKLVEQANTTGSNVPKAKVMAEFGATPADDKCDRSDILVSNGEARNSGSTYCRFSSVDLPPAVLKAQGLARVRANPTRMYGWLGKEMSVVSTGANKAIGATDSAISTSDAKAPFITFDGAGGVKLTENYGGPLQSMSRIAIAGRPKQVVLSTANGCIAVAEEP